MCIITKKHRHSLYAFVDHPNRVSLPKAMATNSKYLVLYNNSDTHINFIFRILQLLFLTKRMLYN